MWNRENVRTVNILKKSGFVTHSRNLAVFECLS